MKIRRKLLLAFGLFILLLFAGGFIGFFELRTIGKRLALVEAADDMSNTVLEVRRYEKNFQLYKDEKDLRELRTQLGHLRVQLDRLFGEIVEERGVGRYNQLRGAIVDYERYNTLLASYFRSAMELERRVGTLGAEAERGLAGARLQAFLGLRAHEKNLLVNRDEGSIDAFLGVFKGIERADSGAVERYGDSVQELARLYRSTVYVTESMRERARELHEFAVEFSAQERRGIDATLRRARTLLIVTLLAIIVLGAAINVKLATSISAPLANLERITRKIAEGDFSESIPVRGRDEIASLETTFNQMEDRLREAFSSLELAIKNLHEKQEQLVEAEKLASLGTLAAGVAHEINNPLAIINEKAGLIQDLLGQAAPFPERERVLALLEGIGRSVHRCRTITHRLLGFARRMDVVPESLNLDESLREVIEFLSSEMLFKDIKVETDFAALFPIWSDREQLAQVFLNIIKNAVDALDRGGHIWIATAPMEKRAVLVTIRDDGPGIPKERLRRIFEPFFTTKGREKGTGLGLSVSYGIMRKLGGTIRVESEVGAGTTFTVEVPVLSPAYEPDAAGRGGSPAR